MSRTWSIREAERRDVPELLAIEVAQFPEPWTRAMLLDEITDTETRRYTVAVEGKRIIGYLGVMYVLGKGVATLLMDDAWRVAKERGIVRATLEVAVTNTRAQALYFRFGFSPVGVRKNYYERTKEDALVLWADFDVTS